jgi:hypothetical protein
MIQFEPSVTIRLPPAAPEAPPNVAARQASKMVMDDNRVLQREVVCGKGHSTGQFIALRRWLAQ